MGNIYGPPAVGKFNNVFDEESKGIAFIRLQAIGGETNFTFLVQSISIARAERIQEVRTLADTEHLYTFGKELPRLNLTGYIINEAISPLTADQYEQEQGGPKSSAITDLWNSSMRAKAIGDGDSDLGPFPIEVDLELFGKVLIGVGVNLVLGNDINLEALVTATLSMIVTSEETL